MTEPIRVWCGQFSNRKEIDCADWEILSVEERQRALRYRERRRQAQFTQVHAAKRRLLAEIVEIDAKELEIKKNPHGKPYLTSLTDWCFNLSHSDHVWVMALTRSCLVGIDIEKIQNRRNLTGIAKKCFDPDEFDYWSKLPESLRIDSFFQFWTGKEAFVKATGKGLSLGLQNCVLDLQKTGQFVAVPPSFGGAADWRYCQLELLAGYCCAVVYNGMQRDLIIGRNDFLNHVK